jgi:protein-L-isoaspartate(D-aspartate) O-methyltransferase
MPHDCYAARRAAMVATQIVACGATDPAVLAAMRTVPCEAFVPPELAELAYDDLPLPIGEGQTISQPYIVALMTAALLPSPADQV